MSWYKKAIEEKPYKYLGQCDRLRCDGVGERNWQRMINNHTKVSMDEFMSQCDWKAIVDEDEDEDEEALGNFTADDPESYFAKSVWRDVDCYYLMHAGFEFIFIKA